jgi:hypothetical protein
MSQYAERYPVGQRQIKMLDETLENTNAGLSHPDMFKYVNHRVHLANSQLWTQRTDGPGLPTWFSKIYPARLNRDHLPCPRFIFFLLPSNLK